MTRLTIPILLGGLVFTGCADCIAVACEDTLAVAVEGVASGEFTIRVRDLDSERVATRSCGAASCPNGVASFPDFVPDRIEVSVTAAGETRSATFTVVYEEHPGACADCNLGVVTFSF